MALAPHPVTADPAIDGAFPRGSNAVDFIGWTARVQPAGAAKTVASYWSSDDSERRPFLILNDAGKGRTAYFAAAIDQSYWIAPYQYQRPLLVNAVRWAAQDNQPAVAVNAPMCVQANFFEQEGGRRVIVHLVNEINTTADRALPESNPSMREEVVPIAGITVAFKSPTIRQVFLEPEHVPLPLEQRDGRLVAEVPKLELHAMVVAEK